jgi:hypothetical protein
MPTYTSEQQEDMKAVGDLGRVVEVAIERNSWGKSRSDMMCRFPNTMEMHPLILRTFLMTMVHFAHILKDQQRPTQVRLMTTVIRSTLSFGIQH